MVRRSSSSTAPVSLDDFTHVGAELVISKEALHLAAMEDFRVQNSVRDATTTWANANGARDADAFLLDRLRTELARSYVRAEQRLRDRATYSAYMDALERSELDEDEEEAS